MEHLPEKFGHWFAGKGWQIHPHQADLLARKDDPATLLIAPTGGGKTLAGFLPTLVEMADGTHEGLHTLYISPLKALAADIKRNLQTPVAEMELPIRIEDRTDRLAGDDYNPPPVERACHPHPATHRYLHRP